MHRVTVHVSTKDGSSWTTAEFELAEMKCLRAFRDEALGLSETLTRAGFDGVQIRLHAVAGEPLSCFLQTSLLDELVLSPVLMRLRPFILQKERTYLTKVTGILNRRVENSKFRDRIQRECDHFFGRRNSQGIVVTSGSTVLNSLDAAMDWLNAFQFHRVQEKQEAFHRIAAPLPLKTGLVFNQLCDVIRAVLNIAYVVEAVLNPRDRSLDMRRFGTFKRAG